MTDWKGIGKVVIAIILLVVIIYAIAIAFKPVGDFFSAIMQGKIPNILGLSPLGFLLIIVCGAIAFAGYVFYQLNFIALAKICLYTSPILLFFGSLLIELSVFQAYFTQTTMITLEQCKETFSITNLEQVPVFITCIFTGYFPAASVSFSSLAFVSFIIFFWLLPFVFLFAFLYGLFGSIMSPMFGGGEIGKTVTMVITFIVATYGARQMIGAFLIDFFAYGSWGLVGIFIPLILAVGMKKILDSFIPIKFRHDMLWRTIGVDQWAEIKRLEDEVRQLQQAKMGLEQAGKDLGDVRSRADSIIAMARGLENSPEPTIRTAAQVIIQTAKTVKG